MPLSSPQLLMELQARADFEAAHFEDEMVDVSPVSPRELLLMTPTSSRPATRAGHAVAEDSLPHAGYPRTAAPFSDPEHAISPIPLSGIMPSSTVTQSAIGGPEALTDSEVGDIAHVHMSPTLWWHLGRCCVTPPHTYGRVVHLQMPRASNWAGGDEATSNPAWPKSPAVDHGGPGGWLFMVCRTLTCLAPCPPRPPHPPPLVPRTVA